MISDIYKKCEQYSTTFADSKYTICFHSKDLGYEPLFHVSNEFHGFLIMKLLTKISNSFVMLDSFEY